MRWLDQRERHGWRCSDRSRRGASLVVMLLLAVVLVAACSSQPSARGGMTATPTATPHPKLAYRQGAGTGQWIPYAQVTFTRSTSYATALRLITDLDLQPVWHCSGVDEGTGTPWSTRGIGEADGFAALLRAGQAPVLGVVVASRVVYLHDVSLYYAAPSDWPVRLSQQDAVTLVDDRAMGCTGLPLDRTPVPGRLYFLDPNKTPTYVRVTFSRGTTSDQALAAISGLGFRLADPCYEQAQPKPAWHPMGQEASYASSASLTIATTGANSTAWQQQLTSTVGVMHITAPYQPNC